jgi:hypothetical protein
MSRRSDSNSPDAPSASAAQSVDATLHYFWADRDVHGEGAYISASARLASTEAESKRVAIVTFNSQSRHQRGDETQNNCLFLMHEQRCSKSFTAVGATNRGNLYSS